MRKSLQQRRDEERRAERNRRILDMLLGMFLTLIFSVFIVWLGLNFLMGCGEHFYTADGSIVYGECFLHPWTPPLQ